MHGLYLEYRKEHRPINETKVMLPANQTVHLAPNQEIGGLNVSLPTTDEISEHRDAPLWIIMLAILGIVIADHFADNLQNPSRAYLLDVCSEGIFILIVIHSYSIYSFQIKKVQTIPTEL